MGGKSKLPSLGFRGAPGGIGIDTVRLGKLACIFTAVATRKISYVDLGGAPFFALLLSAIFIVVIVVWVRLKSLEGRKLQEGEPWKVLSEALTAPSSFTFPCAQLSKRKIIYIETLVFLNFLDFLRF